MRSGLSCPARVPAPRRRPRETRAAGALALAACPSAGPLARGSRRSGDATAGATAGARRAIAAAAAMGGAFNGCHSIPLGQRALLRACHLHLASRSAAPLSIRRHGALEPELATAVRAALEVDRLAEACGARPRRATLRPTELRRLHLRCHSQRRRRRRRSLGRARLLQPPHERRLDCRRRGRQREGASHLECGRPRPVGNVLLLEIRTKRSWGV